MAMKRRQKKRKGGKIFQEERCSQAHESRQRKERLRFKLRISQLERKLQQQEKLLKEYDITPKSLPKEKKKGPDGWQLRGAARPAALLARIESGEVDCNGNEFKKVITENYYEKYYGKFWDHPDSREYIKVLYDLAIARSDGGYVIQSIENLETCLKLDKEDHINATEILICRLLDEGRAGEARKLLEKARSSSVVFYCHLLIEYVSWKVLKEEDASEDIVLESFNRAYERNPFIAIFLCGFETFSEVVEYIDEIESPKAGTIEESFVYCSKNVGVWLDTVGLQEWLREQLEEKELPVVNEDSYMDEMYKGMYETAMEMVQESDKDDQ